MYLEKHPEKWNQPAAYLVRQALMEAFPKIKENTVKRKMR